MPYAVLHLLHKYEKNVKICKIWAGSLYVCSQVHSFIFVSVCLLAMVLQSGNSGGDVSSFACNQLSLLSLQSIACFHCEVFRCCLLSLQNIAFSANYSMNPAIRQTFTACSTKQTMNLCSLEDFCYRLVFCCSLINIFIIFEWCGH